MRLSVDVSKNAGKVANNVDSDQTPPCAASDLGRHCLLRSICPNTYGIYDIFLCYLTRKAIKKINKRQFTSVKI